MKNKKYNRIESCACGKTDNLQRSCGVSFIEWVQTSSFVCKRVLRMVYETPYRESIEYLQPELLLFESMFCIGRMQRFLKIFCIINMLRHKRTNNKVCPIFSVNVCKIKLLRRKLRIRNYCSYITLTFLEILMFHLKNLLFFTDILLIFTATSLRLTAD